MEITLPDGTITLVDEETWLRKSLFLYSWYVKKSGSGRIYVAASKPTAGRGSKKLLLHREMLNAPEGMQVDHINGDTLDNRVQNLRLCNQHQNQANTGARGGSSKYKGVSWVKKRKKWLCAFRANGQHVFVGWFDDEHEAAEAFNREAFKRLGEFARLNATPR